MSHFAFNSRGIGLQTPPFPYDSATCGPGKDFPIEFTIPELVNLYFKIKKLKIEFSGLTLTDEFDNVASSFTPGASQHFHLTNGTYNELDTLNNKWAWLFNPISLSLPFTYLLTDVTEPLDGSCSVSIYPEVCNSSNSTKKFYLRLGVYLVANQSLYSFTPTPQNSINTNFCGLSLPMYSSSTIGGNLSITSDEQFTY